MNIASIDIGSNTVILLIVEIKMNNELIVLKNEYRMPRISKGIGENNIINEDNYKRLAKVLDEYKLIIDNYNCEKVIAIGTNAFRIAENSNEILKRISKEFGIDVEIVTGEREANLSYLGASSSISSIDENLAVLDIGGSSTEIIIGINENISSINSLQLGVVTLSELYVKNYPIDTNSKKSIIKHITKQFSSLENLKIDKIIAVAGTPTSVACMIEEIQDYDEKVVEGYSINVGKLKLLTERLSKLEPPMIREQFGKVVEGRDDIIYAGSVILLEFMQKYSLKEIIVSGRGLRYGAVIEYLKNRKK